MNGERARMRPGVNRRWMHALMAAVFMVGWLLPVAWKGLFREWIPVGGVGMNGLWNISALFTLRSGAWTNYYYQVREAGSETWVTVPDSDVSPMRPYGYCVRVHRAIVQGNRDPGRPAVLKHLALFVKQRYETLHPERPRVEEVRFVQVRYPVGSPETAETPARWQIPPLEEVPADRHEVEAAYIFLGELVKN